MEHLEIPTIRSTIVAVLPVALDMLSQRAWYPLRLVQTAEAQFVSRHHSVVSGV